MKKFVTAVEETMENDTPKTEDEVRGTPITYDLDGRVMKAYKPHEGQLTFMMAGLGRGQTDDQRYATIVNIIMAAHTGADSDHLQSRLIENDPKKRLRLPQLEQIFEYLIEEWFADPTRGSSDSADSEPTTSPN